MSDHNCKSLTAVLKSDFGALWNCQQRGNSLEIITPYLYPDDSFVSVFVTTRGDRLIVSDGGHATDFFQGAKDDEPFFNSVISRARISHRVSEFKQGGKTFYFKDTKEKKLISSIAFDLCNFLVASSNAAALAMSEDDSIDKNSFRQMADKFIKPQITRGRTVKFNQKIPEVKEATFSAVITSNSALWIIIYLTGSNLKYFQLSVANAIFNVESANKSIIQPQIRSIYPLLNDDAVGYQPQHLQQRLSRLTGVTKTPIIPWKKRDELARHLLNAA